MGNLNVSTIEEIWNGPGYQKLRAGMASGDLAAAGCADCHAVRQGMGLAFEYDPDSDQESELPEPDQSPYARNIIKLKSEIAAGATRLQSKPTIVSYTPSHRCNIRCTHCYQETTRTAEISRERAHDEITEIAPYLVRLVAGGGEPFLLPIWVKFLNEFDLNQNKYLDFATSTNATILSDKVAAGLQRFKKLTINVSMDGTGAAYERVRVGAKFVHVRDNIRKLRKIVGSTTSTNSALGVSMCVMKSNILDLPNFIRFCTEDGLAFGLTPVTMLPPVESLRHFRDGAIETQGWLQALEEAEQLVHSLYLPHMAKLRNAPEAHAVEHEFWRNNFKLLRDAIPFDLSKVAPRAIEIILPRQLRNRFPALQHGTPGTTGYVYQVGQTYLPFTSGPAVDDVLRVSLPPGRYCVNLPQEDEIPEYWDVVQFEVPTTTIGRLNANYHVLTRRRVQERVRRITQSLRGSVAG